MSSCLQKDHYAYIYIGLHYILCQFSDVVLHFYSSEIQTCKRAYLHERDMQQIKQQVVSYNQEN